MGARRVAAFACAQMQACRNFRPPVWLMPLRQLWMPHAAIACAWAFWLESLGLPAGLSGKLHGIANCQPLLGQA